jgi:hypothetical protein
VLPGDVAEKKDFIAIFQACRGLQEIFHLDEMNPLESRQIEQGRVEVSTVSQDLCPASCLPQFHFDSCLAKPVEKSGKNSQHLLEGFRDDEISPGRKGVEENAVAIGKRTRRVGFADEQFSSSESRRPMNAANGVSVLKLSQETELGDGIGLTGDVVHRG